MVWWVWMLLGIALVIIELTVMSASFFLIFIGTSAILVGILAAVFPGMPDWSTVPLFAATALVLMVAFRRKLYQGMTNRLPGYPSTVIGERIRVMQEIKAGEIARVEYRGASWSIENATTASLPADSWAEVSAVRGTTLMVEPVKLAESREGKK